ncbi:hypothetical protein [uncultured Chryseobacterium sp.]|uniref:hypothetical protein n=1 Tax=uncultured Chryseobacterium sp. TaxID=259322 RepID=UPI0025DC4658|nr:hypothetical protein [uncultured Chryseobacterium sp.]
MKKIKIKYTQLLFLYAYLRLIDLSLDRSKWTSWTEFQDYFKRFPAPSLVAQYIIDSFDLPKTDFRNFIYFPEKKSYFNRLMLIISKTIFINEIDIIYCCKLLLNFNGMLNFNNDSQQIEILKLRIDIAEYYSDILGKMILFNDLNRLMRIEHFWENEDFDHLKLEKLIPDDFPKS